MQSEDLFEEIGGKPESEKTDDDLFADIPPSSTDSEPQQDEQTEQPTPPTGGAADEMFEEMGAPGPGGEPKPQPPVDTPAQSAEMPAAPVQTDEPADIPSQKSEEPIYDLYELGAVDYEPSVHQNA